MYQWSVEFYCTKCNEAYELSYYYSEALKKNDAYEIPVLDQERIDAYKKMLTLHKAVELGQLSLEGMEYAWPGNFSVKATEAMVLWWEERDEDEPFSVQAVWKDRDDNVFPFLDEDSGSVPTSINDKWLTLWCPKCGTYNVIVSHPVEGY